MGGTRGSARLEKGGWKRKGERLVWKKTPLNERENELRSRGKIRQNVKGELETRARKERKSRRGAKERVGIGLMGKGKPYGH